MRVVPPHKLESITFFFFFLKKKAHSHALELRITWHSASVFPLRPPLRVAVLPHVRPERRGENAHSQCLYLRGEKSVSRRDAARHTARPARTLRAHAAL